MKQSNYFQIGSKEIKAINLVVCVDFFRFHFNKAISELYMHKNETKDGCAENILQKKRGTELVKFMKSPFITKDASRYLFILLSPGSNVY